MTKKKHDFDERQQQNSNSQAAEIIDGLEEMDEQQLPQYLQRKKKTSLLEDIGISLIFSAWLYWSENAPIEFAVGSFLILALVISYGFYVIDKQKAQKYVQRLNEK